jgi:hypothetical protein
VARNRAQILPMWRKMKEMRGSAQGGPEATRTFSMVPSFKTASDLVADRTGDMERGCRHPEQVIELSIPLG